MHKTLLSIFSIICLLSCYIEQIFLQVVNDFDIEEEEVAIENREEFLQKIEKRVRYCILFILFHRGLQRIERFVEAQAFLRSYDLAPRPPPPPRPSVSWTGDTEESGEIETIC
jgi:hypothetical protein